MPIRGQPGWIYTVLRKAITSGMLKQGDPLAESRVAANLGVSRAPVREAFARLKAVGLISETGSGRTTVRSFTLSEIQGVLFVRRVLELAAVELACDRSRPQPAARSGRLREILAEEAASHRSGPTAETYEVNLRFHLAVVDLAGNDDLRQTILTSLDRIQIALAASPHSADNLAVSHAQHIALVEAIERCDATQARQLLDTHLASTEANIRRSFEQRPLGGERDLMALAEELGRGART